MKLRFVFLSGLFFCCTCLFAAEKKSYLLVDSEEVWMNVNKDSSLDVTEVRKIAFSGQCGVMSREFLLLGCDQIKIQELRVDNLVYRSGAMLPTAVADH